MKTGHIKLTIDCVETNNKFVIDILGLRKKFMKTLLEMKEE